MTLEECWRDATAKQEVPGRWNLPLDVPGILEFGKVKINIGSKNTFTLTINHTNSLEILLVEPYLSDVDCKVKISGLLVLVTSL